VVLYIFYPSLVAWLFFRVLGKVLGSVERTKHFKPYAKLYAWAAVFWGPLMLGWYYGLNQNYSYYVPDTSKPPIGRYASTGACMYPEKYVYHPRFHYGIGYEFNLGNPVAKYIHDLLGDLGVICLMSFVDVLILGTIFSAIRYRRLRKLSQ
jgi:hypothetical protein